MAFTGRENTFLESTVDNTPFFPELSLGDFQRMYRVPIERAQDAVELRLRTARNTINDQLAVIKREWEAEGFTTLLERDVAKGLDLTANYLDAVFSKAKADLLTDFETFTRRDHAENTAREGEDTRQALLANSHRALRKLLGIKTTITAEIL